MWSASKTPSPFEKTMFLSVKCQRRSIKHGQNSRIKTWRIIGIFVLLPKPLVEMAKGCGKGFKFSGRSQHKKQLTCGLLMVFLSWNKCDPPSEIDHFSFRLEIVRQWEGKSGSRTADSIGNKMTDQDLHPLNQNLLRLLTEKIYEKRKTAALEVERFVFLQRISFSSSRVLENCELYLGVFFFIGWWRSLCRQIMSRWFKSWLLFWWVMYHCFPQMFAIIIFT